MSRRRLTLREIQQYELEMFQYFIEVCERYGLRYYLAGGTLLGAVRHHGFIPWDDDMDILMPRPDYMAFVNLDHERLFPQHVRVASYEKGNLNYPFCKIFNTRIEIEKIYVLDPTEINLWIDILPMDGLPDDPKKVERIFRKSLVARRILKSQKAVLGRGTTPFRKAMKYVVKPILNLIGIQRVLDYLNRLALKYDFDSAAYIGGIVMGYGPQEAMPKDEYLPIEKMQFENLSVNVPKCWDYYLTSLYGDYMTLPPEEKRRAHSMTIWIEE